MSVITEQSTPPIPARTAMVFQGALGLIGLALILVLAIPVGWRGEEVWNDVVWGLIGAGLTFVALFSLIRVPGPVQRLLRQHWQDLRVLARGYPPGVLMALSLLAGVGEELLFRGAIQGWLGTQVPAIVAVVMASLLFGLVHYLSWLYALLATVMGLVLGVAYWLTDSLLLVMVWHGVYDLIALFFLRWLPYSSDAVP